MNERIRLADYQEDLARRLQESASAGTGSTHVGVRSGAVDWLVDLRDAQEIIPMPPVTRIPLVQPWLLGLANVRGGLVTIVDFAALRGEPATPLAPEARLLVLAPRFGVSAGLLFARSEGLVNVRALERGPVAALPEWAAAAYKDREDSRGEDRHDRGGENRQLSRVGGRAAGRGGLRYELAIQTLVRSTDFLGAALH